MIPWLRVFEHWCENCSGVVATPFGELGLTQLTKDECEPNIY